MVAGTWVLTQVDVYMYMYTSGDENHLCRVSLHESHDSSKAQKHGAGTQTAWDYI